MKGGKSATKVIKGAIKTILNQSIIDTKGKSKEGKFKEINCGRIALFGKPEAGKISIINKFKVNAQSWTPSSTNIESTEITMKIENGHLDGTNYFTNCELQNMSENFKMECPFSYRQLIADATTFLLVCSLNQVGNIESIREILDDIKQLRQDDVPILLVEVKENNISEGRGRSNLDVRSKRLGVECRSISFLDDNSLQEIVESVVTKSIIYTQEVNKELCLSNEEVFVDKKRRN